MDYSDIRHYFLTLSEGVNLVEIYNNILRTQSKTRAKEVLDVDGKNHQKVLDAFNTLKTNVASSPYADKLVEILKIQRGALEELAQE